MLRVGRSDDRRSWGILAGRFRRRIDPHRVRQDFEARRALHEALGMRGVRGQARVMTDLEHRGGAPVDETMCIGLNPAAFLPYGWKNS